MDIDSKIEIQTQQECNATRQFAEAPKHCQLQPNVRVIKNAIYPKSAVPKPIADHAKTRSAFLFTGTKVPGFVGCFANDTSPLE